MSRIRVKINRTVEFDARLGCYPDGATSEEILEYERKFIERGPELFFALTASATTKIEDIVEVTYVEEADVKN